MLIALLLRKKREKEREDERKILQEILHYMYACDIINIQGYMHIIPMITIVFIDWLSLYQCI